MHRGRDAHRADLARERRLVEIDWQRIGFTSPQLLYEGGSIIAGLDRLLGRSWDRADWPAGLHCWMNRSCDPRVAPKRRGDGNEDTDPDESAGKVLMAGRPGCRVPAVSLLGPSHHVQDDR